VGVETKTPGQLIDELFTVSMKLWVTQDSIHAMTTDEEDWSTEVISLAMDLNRRRTELIAAIDGVLGHEPALTKKVYRSDGRD
jgi:hypothetical protein